MTSYELLAILDDFSEILSRPLTVLGVITSLAGIWREISNQLRESLTASNFQAAVGQANAKVGEATNYIRTQAPSRFVPELNALKDSVEAFLTSLSAQVREPLQRLSQLLGNFTRSYDAVMQSHSQVDAVALLSCAADLNEVLDTARKMVAFVRVRLSGEVPLQKGFDRLVIFLVSNNEAGSVAERIAALNQVYESLCALLDVDTREYPLTIQRCEVGSLFLSVVGNGDAIRLLGDLLKRALDFIYKNSTEGKLDSLPRRLEDLEHLLKVRDELVKRGVKSEHLDQGLLEATTTLGAGMTKLLQRTMKVSIDSEVREVPSRFRARVESQERRKLEAPSEGEDTDHLPSGPKKGD